MWPHLPASSHTSHISRINSNRRITDNRATSLNVKTRPPGDGDQRRRYIKSPSRSVKSSTCPYASSSQPLATPISIPVEEKDEMPLVRSMDDLPGPVGWPVVGNFLTYLKKENKGKMHLVQASLHKKYGKIFREKWGSNWQVHVGDARLMEEIHRHEGRYPNRPSLQSWILYRRLHNMPLGITTAQGKEWQLYRTEFGKRLFCPQGIKSLVEPINQVSDDLVSKLKETYHQHGPSSIAPALPNAAYLWSLEAAGSFLFETRLGCLSPHIPKRTQLFLDNLFEMMASSLFLIVGEKFHQKYNTRFWKQHSKSWDNIFQIGKELIDERVEALEKKHSDSGPYLSHLLDNPNLTKDQIYTNITELLMAGSDTTANTLCFALYLLAKNPEKQQKLKIEIDNVLKSSSSSSSLSSPSPSSSNLQITTEHLPKLKYLKFVVKETMRMFPVVTMNCRILDNDIVLDGYKIPKNTLFVMNQFSSSVDPDYFHQPEKFMPERWQRNQNNNYNDLFDVEDVSISNDNNPNNITRTNINPNNMNETYEEELEAENSKSMSNGRSSKRHAFACIPFGFGSRSCLGKHVANLELMVSIAKIVDTFQLEAIEGEELGTNLRTLLNPGKRVPINLVPRE